MKKVPNDYVRSDEEILSNYDGEINTRLAEEIKDKNLWAEYPAWNFWGAVWFDCDTDKWCCEIWRHRVHRETIEAKTLEKIMEAACNSYGYD